MHSSLAPSPPHSIEINIICTFPRSGEESRVEDFSSPRVFLPSLGFEEEFEGWRGIDRLVFARSFNPLERFFLVARAPCVNICALGIRIEQPCSSSIGCRFTVDNRSRCHAVTSRHAKWRGWPPLTRRLRVLPRSVLSPNSSSALASATQLPFVSDLCYRYRPPLHARARDPVSFPNLF